jgi:hypothetical protein
MLLLEEIFKTKKIQQSDEFNLRIHRGLSWLKQALLLDHDPDNPTPPGTDDDESDAYISVKITINPWTYWTQGVDLH